MFKWTRNTATSCSGFFHCFAETRNLDCRVPSEWSVPFDDAKIEHKELFTAEA